MGRLITVLMLLLALSGCVEKRSDPKQGHLYTIVSKKKVDKSYCSFEITKTNYYLTVKDEAGDVTVRKCSSWEFHKFEVGKSYKGEYPGK